MKYSETFVLRLKHTEEKIIQYLSTRYTRGTKILFVIIQNNRNCTLQKKRKDFFKKRKQFKS